MQEKFLKFGTFLIVAAIGVMLAMNHLKKQEQAETVQGSETSATQSGQPQDGTETSGTFGSVDSADKDQPNSVPIETTDQSTLRVGVIGSTPERTTLTRLTSIPYKDTQMRREYLLAKERACRLLIEGVGVSQPLAAARTGSAGQVGRATALTVGLNLATGGTMLPSVTKAQVVSYFREHRLAIQPVVYHDSRGRLYFGTDCRAAFFRLDRPGTTVKAEPMIEESVSRFRSLGVVGKQGEDSENEKLGRTLALAFSFMQSDPSLPQTANNRKQVIEMLFLHLPEGSTAQSRSIKVEAYVTSDGRKNLHRLDVNNLQINGPSPVITSDIRFDSTALMGLYPADPVVTKINYRSSGILSMDTVRRMSGSDSGGEAKLTITEILDQFGKLSGES